MTFRQAISNKIAMLSREEGIDHPLGLSHWSAVEASFPSHDGNPLPLFPNIFLLFACASHGYFEAALESL
jgi:hypothetical protein